MRLFFIIALCLVFTCMAAQASGILYKPVFKEEKSVGVWLGYNLQGNRSDETGATKLKYLETGTGKGKYFSHMHGITGRGNYLTEETLLNGHKRIYGTKLGVFAHWLFNAGFSIVYYTAFEKGNLKRRPKLGVGVGRVRAVVGFNIPTIHNRAMPGLRKQNAQLTIQAGLGVNRKTIKQT